MVVCSSKILNICELCLFLTNDDENYGCSNNLAICIGIPPLGKKLYLCRF
jgi:hypothetical protein